MKTGECNQCRYFAGQKDAIGDCRQGPPATILYPNPDYPAAAYAQSEWPRGGRQNRLVRQIQKKVKLTICTARRPKATAG